MDIIVIEGIFRWCDRPRVLESRLTHIRVGVEVVVLDGIEPNSVIDRIRLVQSDAHESPPEIGCPEALPISLPDLVEVIVIDVVVRRGQTRVPRRQPDTSQPRPPNRVRT